jgi:hypothetical protein
MLKEGRIDIKGRREVLTRRIVAGMREGYEKNGRNERGC